MRKENLRILLASDHYPPFIGGAHRQTQLLGQELSRRGHHVEVATVWHPGLPAEEEEAGLRVHRFRQLRTVGHGAQGEIRQRYQPPFPDPVTAWGLRRLIGRLQPDLVHAYGWFSYSVAAALVGKSIPLLISARDYAYGCPARTLVYRNEAPCSGPEPVKCLDCAGHYYGAPRGWVAVLGVAAGDALLRRKVQGVHSISSYVQAMVRRDFLRGDTAPVVEAIIPSFRENDQEVAFGSDPVVRTYLDRLPVTPFILFVGALRRVKGIDQLLAAYTRLPSPPPLVLIGTYESDSPANFPPGVHVLADVPHRAVMAAWDRAAFGVVPSLWPEPLGSVVYEGMSRGKAVIGTTPGGHTDMIAHNQTGLLVPPGDVDALAAAMQRLIEDPARCAQFGHAGRLRARQFTAAVNVPRFEQLYRQLLEGKQAGSAQPAPAEVMSR
jgi:glycosyltransferase involved in cell wall biosynthesis